VSGKKKDPHSELLTWWAELSRADAEKAALKAEEYGSDDLRQIGRTLARCMGRLPAVSDVELGIYFYVLGKLARITDAIQHGRMPSDDSWRDLETYARMVRRTRATGGDWPGVLS
jgi:hypothetical protein